MCVYVYTYAYICVIYIYYLIIYIHMSYIRCNYCRSELIQIVNVFLGPFRVSLRKNVIPLENLSSFYGKCNTCDGNVSHTLRLRRGQSGVPR